VVSTYWRCVLTKPCLLKYLKIQVEEMCGLWGRGEGRDRAQERYHLHGVSEYTSLSEGNLLSWWRAVLNCSTARSEGCNDTR